MRNCPNGIFNDVTLKLRYSIVNAGVTSLFWTDSYLFGTD